MHQKEQLKHIITRSPGRGNGQECFGSNTRWKCFLLSYFFLSKSSQAFGDHQLPLVMLSNVNRFLTLQHSLELSVKPYIATVHFCRSKSFWIMHHWHHFCLVKYTPSPHTMDFIMIDVCMVHHDAKCRSKICFHNASIYLSAKMFIVTKGIPDGAWSNLAQTNGSLGLLTHTGMGKTHTCVWYAYYQCVIGGSGKIMAPPCYYLTHRWQIVIWTFWNIIWNLSNNYNFDSKNCM